METVNIFCRIDGKTHFRFIKTLRQGQLNKDAVGIGSSSITADSVKARDTTSG